MDIDKVRLRFQNSIGIIDQNLSHEEFEKIFSEIKSLAPGQRSIRKIQELVKAHSSIENFEISKYSDNSDIDNLIDLIKDALKK